MPNQSTGSQFEKKTIDRLFAFPGDGLIGLWTGDEDKDLICERQRGSEIGQAPKIMFEVRISSEDQDHPINH